MSDAVGTLSYYDSTGQSDMAFTKPYSELTAQGIDNAVKELIDEAYALAKQTINDHREGLVQLAELLLEREVVFTEDVERIFGKRKKDIEREQAEQDKKQAESATEEAVPQTEIAEAVAVTPSNEQTND